MQTKSCENSRGTARNKVMVISCQSWWWVPHDFQKNWWMISKLTQIQRRQRFVALPWSWVPRSNLPSGASQLDFDAFVLHIDVSVTVELFSINMSISGWFKVNTIPNKPTINHSQLFCSGPPHRPHLVRQPKTSPNNGREQMPNDPIPPAQNT